MIYYADDCKYYITDILFIAIEFKMCYEKCSQNGVDFFAMIEKKNADAWVD